MKPRSGNYSGGSGAGGITHLPSGNASDINDPDDNKEAKRENQQAAKLMKVFVVTVMLVGVAALAIIVDDESETLERERLYKQQQLNLGGSGSASDAADVITGIVSDHNDHDENNNHHGMVVGPSEEELQIVVNELDSKVRQHKSQPNMIMETDPEGKRLTKQLQDATHKLLLKRYNGHTKFRVKVDLTFPDIIVEKDKLPKQDYILIEMASIDLIPCSVYNFLEIARTWHSGSFHRNANHVLQVQSRSDVKKSMPFQEYSKEFPHKKGTTGYAGRPSGPGWYVSIQDNTRNHGPGSQQQKNPYEADSNFGFVVRGFEGMNQNKTNPVMRIHSTPQSGWLNKENQIQIPKMTILVAENNEDNNNGEQQLWMPFEHK